MWGFVNLWAAVWPVLIGLAMVATLRRLNLTSGIQRIFACLTAGLLVTIAASPRDTLTGHIIPSDAVHLVFALLMGLGFICVMFDTEFRR